MLFLIGAIALAIAALSATWGTFGTIAILITAMAWLTVAFRPNEAGALVTTLVRRRFE
jgi:TM2 domain-containing membrane protein YozV